MKILALMGSPRKQGNTDLLINEIQAGAEGAGHQYEQLNLYDLDISPCTDCRDCSTGPCSIDDDMQDIYPKIEGADVIIFGTPLYWYGPSGPMKLLIDRLLPYGESGKLKGKKAVLVIPSAEGPTACEAAVRMFQLSFNYLGIDIIHTLLPTAYEKGEIDRDTQTLEQARRIGSAFSD